MNVWMPTCVCVCVCMRVFSEFTSKSFAKPKSTFFDQQLIGWCSSFFLSSFPFNKQIKLNLMILVSLVFLLDKACKQLRKLSFYSFSLHFFFWILSCLLFYSFIYIGFILEFPFCKCLNDIMFCCTYKNAKVNTRWLCLSLLCLDGL